MRELSFWGWGYADLFPAEAERARLGQMIGALLGVEAPLPRPAPTLDGITIPPSKVEIPPQFAAVLSSARDVRASHTYGKGYADLLRGFRGDFSAAPDLVATPTNEEEVAALLAWAEANKVAVIPFGGGTSVVAGTEADVSDRFAGTVSLDMRKLNRLISFSQKDRLAHFEAGITGPDIEAALAPYGMTLRHFPQSFEFSTLGGWVATRSGGHFATLYTHIDEMVAAARMLTPRGVFETPLWPASGAGPDPNRLICGSEGALGVITSAHLRVRPKPRWRSKANIRFRDWSDAVKAVRDVAQTDLYPANCRLLDSREAMLHGAGAGSHHLLLLGFESATGSTEAAMAQAISICRAQGGELATPAKHSERGEVSQRDDKAGGAWRDAFLAAPYRFNSLVSLGMVVDTFETACTWSNFETMHDAIVKVTRGAMKAQTGSSGWISCRFTHVYPDGPAPYYTFIAPGRPGRELEQWRAIKEAASDALAAHGGTITHHHAVGRLHKPWYQRESPPLFGRLLKATKAELDPHGILNPGALIDEIPHRG